MELFNFPADIAKICQSNLRKNFLYGGRRHLPFPVEMEALLVWRGREGEGAWGVQCHGVSREEAGAVDKQWRAGMRKEREEHECG